MQMIPSWHFSAILLLHCSGVTLVQLSHFKEADVPQPKPAFISHTWQLKELHDKYKFGQSEITTNNIAFVHFFRYLIALLCGFRWTIVPFLELLFNLHPLLDHA